MEKALKLQELSRRNFLRNSAAFLSGMPLILDSVLEADARPEETKGSTPSLSSGKNRSDAKVAIVACSSYSLGVRDAMLRCFDLLGGIRALVRGKTVTVKVNLTMEGQKFFPMFNHTAGETYQTHYATALALNSILFAEGARRVRIVESMRFRDPMEEALVKAGWNVNELMSLGPTEFENTRNLGKGQQYADLRVSAGGYLFSHFPVNHILLAAQAGYGIADLNRIEVCGLSIEETIYPYA